MKGSTLSSKPSQRQQISVLPLATLFGAFLTLSLGLLLGVGLAEAYRTYPSIHLDRLHAQGSVVVRSLESFLYSGVPLDQVSGFESLTRPLMESSKDLKSVKVFDSEERTLFVTRQQGIEAEAGVDGAALEALYEVDLPLESRFERVGHLKLAMSQTFVRQDIQATFADIFKWAVVVLVLCGSTVAAALRLHPEKARMILSGVFGMAILAVSGTLITQLVQLYSEGIAAKTAAITASLGHRLQAPIDLGFRLTDLDGLEDTFAEYRTHNPEISAIGLLEGNKILIHTDAGRVGEEAVSDEKAYEKIWDLEGLRHDGAHGLRLKVSVPKSVVYSNLWGACKNLLALFVALILVSRLFLSLLMTLSRVEGRSKAAETRGEVQKIQVFHTLTVLMEGLCLPIMATWLSSTLAGQGMGPGAASLIFTAFFLGHALILLPAGRIVGIFGSSHIMRLGVSCCVVGLVGLVFTTQFWGLILLRMLGGVGQGLSVIGTQTGLLDLSTAEQRTKNVSLIVMGYQTGMIAGAAFGSLLALYTSVEAVFYLAALIGLVNLLLGQRLAGRRTVIPTHDRPSPEPRSKLSWKQLLVDRGLISTALLVGIPTKAVASGLVFFGLPLTLAHLKFSADEIGQVLMLYSMGVLLSNLASGRIVRLLGETRKVLLLGMATAGLSLVLIATSTSETWSLGTPDVIRTLFLVLGAWGLGASHGWIHAPALSHVADGPLARLGRTAEVTSLFRFLERVGSIGGTVMAGLLISLGGSAFGLTGLLVFILTGLFAVSSRVQYPVLEGS